jgi:hypothetical protein
VVETVLPNESAWEADKGEHFGNHLDIKFARLFADSGWRLLRVIPTPSLYSIVEAVAV